MTYDPRIHHRRSIRLRGHDYAGGGAYFVTCCVEDKEHLFGRIVESDMLINDCGQVIQQVWTAIPQRFPCVILDSFQMMPNHWHGVLVIPGAGLKPAIAKATGAPVIEPRPRARRADPWVGQAANRDEAGASSARHAANRNEVGASPGPTSPRQIRRAGACPGQGNRPSLGDIVGAFKSISTIAVNRLLSRTGRILLQEDYFEHVIRNVAELEAIRGYIGTNPARWLDDPENIDRRPGGKPVPEWWV